MVEQIHVSWIEFQSMKLDDSRFKQPGNGHWKTEVDIVITDAFARGNEVVSNAVYKKISAFHEKGFEDVRVVYPYKNGICSCFAPREFAVTLYAEAGASLGDTVIASPGVYTFIQHQADYEAEVAGGNMTSPRSRLTAGGLGSSYGATNSALDPVSGPT